MASVKSQIIARLLAICAPLKAEGRFREIKRASAPFLIPSLKPCIHLVVGDEIKVLEDIQGYTLEFPVTFDLIVADASDPYTLADESAAYLQEKVESDQQLMNNEGSGFCSSVVYDGELPYTSEITRPVGGALVMYLVRYRRNRANPSQNY